MTDSRFSYTPRVGDKVRATLGGSRVEGEVAEVRYASGQPIIAWVYPNPKTFDRVELRVGIDDGWQFEQLVSVPSKFGAVIRRADGALHVRAGDPIDMMRWYGRRGWVSDEEATAGGFTVLFDGVDE